MNHFHSDIFQHVTLNFLTTKDIITVLRLNKTINCIVHRYSRFDLGKAYSQEPMQFHFYLERVELPITLEALNILLNVDDKKKAIEEINNPYKNVHHQFITFHKCISNLCFLIPFQLQLVMSAKGPCTLLYNSCAFIIDYDENDSDEEYNYDKINQIMTQIKSK